MNAVNNINYSEVGTLIEVEILDVIIFLKHEANTSWFIIVWGMEINGEYVVSFLIKSSIFSNWNSLKQWTDPSNKRAWLLTEQFDFRDSIAVDVVGNLYSQRMRQVADESVDFFIFFYIFKLDCSL